MASTSKGLYVPETHDESLGSHKHHLDGARFSLGGANEYRRWRSRSRKIGSPIRRSIGLASRGARSVTKDRL
jgi:hypothetical protein